MRGGARASAVTLVDKVEHGLLDLLKIVFDASECRQLLAIKLAVVDGVDLAEALVDAGALVEGVAVGLHKVLERKVANQLVGVVPWVVPLLLKHLLVLLPRTPSHCTSRCNGFAVCVVFRAHKPQMLGRVTIEAAAYTACVTHALSTEREEIMGLLLGEITQRPQGQHEARVVATLVLERADRRKDRVEISPEQLSAATTHAEELSEQTGRYIRVIGWYHSHPHITVWPSHVDVGTQASYQLLDDCFLGLIVSCFAKEGADTDTGQIRMTCFQARSTSSQDPVYIPLFVARNDPSLLAVASHGQLGLVRTLLEEEATRFGATKGDSVLSTLAANSRHSEHLCKLYDCISQPLERCGVYTHQRHYGCGSPHLLFARQRSAGQAGAE
eukprot:m.208397 g.208397  ORF g.208397 m.208397 type:complete len:385 (-) comp10717_c0_seq2:522-1676(-)